MNNRLKELRAALAWSQETLAGMLGVSRQTVISIERGKYDPSLPLAFKIAAVFEEPIEEIFLPDAE
jgi:putative transcriptional regulator